MFGRRSNIDYGPFRDVVCITRKIGPFHFSRVYTTKKLFEMFTEEYCEPTIIAPKMRAQLYTSMLLHKRVGDALYKDGKHIEKMTRQRLASEHNDVIGTGYEYYTEYHQYQTDAICTNISDNPTNYHFIDRYISLCGRFNATLTKIYEMIGGMEIILDEDQKEGFENAGQS